MATNAPPAGENPEQVAPLPNGTQPEEAGNEPPVPESKLATQKDVSLKEFLTKMDDYAPIVRSACIRHAPLAVNVLAAPTRLRNHDLANSADYPIRFPTPSQTTT